ncbi:hypothetical protein ACWD4T_23655 [Streptomyces umbrinus]
MTIAVILAVPVAVHVLWVRTAGAAYMDHARAEEMGNDAVAPEAPTDPSSDEDTSEEQAKTDTKMRYRAAEYPRTGSTIVRVAKGRGGGWQATARHELKLRPDDPMAEDLRRNAQDLGTWLPFTLTVASTNDGCEGEPLNLSSDDWLEQGGPEQAVHAFASADRYWYDTVGTCTDSSTAVTFTMAQQWQGKSGLYDWWTITVESKLRPLTAVVRGSPMEQSAHRIELRLPEKGTAAVGLADAYTREWDSTYSQDTIGVDEFAIFLQKDSSAGREVVLLLAGVIAMTCCWAVPFTRRWAPTPVRKHWTIVCLTAGALTCATLAYDLAGNADSRWYAWWAYPGRSVMLVSWWWVLLPYLLGAFVVRATTGRPPQVRQILPLTLPSILLIVPPVVLCVTEYSVLALVPVAAAIAAAALTAYGLGRGLLGQVGRRWTVTAVGGTWWAVLAAGPGTGLPDTLAVGAFGSYSFMMPWSVANTLAALALSLVWPAVLCPVLAAFSLRKWSGPCASLILWCAASLPSISWPKHDWHKEPLDGPWRFLGINPMSAANVPLTLLQSVILCTTMLYLWRYGRQQGRWPKHVRAAVLSLGITAVGTALTFSGFAPFIDDDEFGSGPYLALTIAVLGFAWLLPSTAELHAVHLHDTSSQAHTRRMQSLLKDQTLAAGRRQFLVSSRTALAEGELTVSQWSARWRALNGLSGQRSLAIRLAALGTSGAQGAWRNGVVAGGLLAVLSLPWFVLTLPSYLSGIGYLRDLPFIVDALSYSARWPLYGFLYGYAYAWLRGRTPLAKAMYLLSVVLSTELAQLLYQDLDPDQFGTRLLMSTGNCLAAFLILGLYWEARLVRAAGLRWGQIRNFRSLSTLAVPATAVLVAVATALATAVVGVWVSPNGGSPTDPPKEPASVTSSSTPGAH